MTADRRTRRAVTPLEQRNLIRELARKGASARQIFELAKARYPHDWPALRTVQNELRKITVDAGAPWRLRDAVDADEASAVFRVLSAVIVRTEGRRNAVTNDEAKWIGRILKVAPDLDPWTIYSVSTEYVLAEHERDSTQREERVAELDTFLAFGPWRSDDDSRRYLKAASQGLLPGKWYFNVNTSEAPDRLGFASRGELVFGTLLESVDGFSPIAGSRDSEGVVLFESASEDGSELIATFAKDRQAIEQHEGKQGRKVGLRLPPGTTRAQLLKQRPARVGFPKDEAAEIRKTIVHSTPKRTTPRRGEK
jgi:hypothetical protein